MWDAQEDLGVWDLGKDRHAWMDCSRGAGAAAPLRIIRGYFWRLQGIRRYGSSRVPFFPHDPYSAVPYPRTEVEEKEIRDPRVPGIQTPQSWG